MASYRGNNSGGDYRGGDNIYGGGSSRMMQQRHRPLAGAASQAPHTVGGSMPQTPSSASGPTVGVGGGGGHQYGVLGAAYGGGGNGNNRGNIGNNNNSSSGNLMIQRSHTGGNLDTNGGMGDPYGNGTGDAMAQHNHYQQQQHEGWQQQPQTPYSHGQQQMQLQTPSHRLYPQQQQAPSSAKDAHRNNEQQQESERGGGGRGAAGNSSISRRCFCLDCYNPSREMLEYDFTYDEKIVPPGNVGATGGGADGKSGELKKAPQPLPRIRERGEYYIDSYNDESWSWTFGTHESNGVWFNSSDQAGSIMSAMVWVLMIYSAVTVTLLTITEGIPVVLGMLYNVLCAMALACHVKTSLTDPGSVPIQAIPSERQRLLKDSHSMCGQCQTFKPPGSHHCRICNRCISRMDHHCPWMNNCVGAGNLKHFLLFLLYTWTCAAFSLGLFGWNYFFCADEDCTFHPIVLHLVRIMTLLCIGAFLFTSSMLMNVCYGIMTGIGTIDRLKKKATNTMSQSDEEPINLIDIFGIAPIYTWPFPVDPIFEDHDRVMGYTMPQRLDRERQFCEAKKSLPPEPVKNSNSMEMLPKCVNDLLPV